MFLIIKMVQPKIGIIFELKAVIDCKPQIQEWFCENEVKMLSSHACLQTVECNFSSSYSQNLGNLRTQHIHLIFTEPSLYLRFTVNHGF